MQSFNENTAQGEISVRKITKLPKGLTDLAPKLVIGHSETGHHHVLERPAKVVVAKDAPPGMRILYALLEEPNALIHERPFDTHEAIALEPGIYEFRIGREYDPYEEIARQQAD